MDQEPLPPEVWGVDHFSTLLYAESRAVDNGGILNPEQMRTGGFRKAFSSEREYPTLLKGGVPLLAAVRPVISATVGLLNIDMPKKIQLRTHLLGGRLPEFYADT